MYEYKGVQYISRHLEYELDTGRGVLYLHDLTIGMSVLRICRIPDGAVDMMLSGTAELDLATTTPRSESIIGEGKVRIAPVFLEVSEESFIVVKETGGILLEVKGVPENILATLREYKFSDITIGWTRR